MSSHVLGKTRGLLAAIFLVPALMMAAPHTSNRAARHAAAPPRAVKQISSLLRDVRQADFKVRNAADTLDSFAFSPDLSWQTHADYLEQAKEQIDHMGKLLSQLETLRSQALPWQRRLLDRIYPESLALAHNTQAAIKFLDKNQENLIAAPYRHDVTGMYKQASRIDRTITRYETYARDHQQERRLARQLKLNS